MRDQTIYGIRCTVNSPALREAIRIVLRQIRHRAPEDFKRVRSRVTGFVPLAPDIRASIGFDARFGALPRDCYDFESADVIELFESPIAHPIAIVSHELGHACTREDDLLQWFDAAFYEKLVELHANAYAYEWGFGRYITRERKRHPEFEWLFPGATFTSGPVGDVHSYCVTRSFRIRDLGPLSPEDKRG